MIGATQYFYTPGDPLNPRKYQNLKVDFLLMFAKSILNQRDLANICRIQRIIAPFSPTSVCKSTEEARPVEYRPKETIPVVALD